MRHLKVYWRSDDPTDPVELYSELDADGWEIRKVERFRDGRLGYASADDATEATGLGLEPIPSLAEIARDPQFLPSEISAEEFERVWTLAKMSFMRPSTV